MVNNYKFREIINLLNLENFFKKKFTKKII